MSKKKHKRLYFILVCTYLIFSLLTIKLFWIQILKGNKYEEAAKKQQNTLIRVKPSRGIIFDRNYIPLTNNNHEKTMFIVKSLIEDNEDVIKYIKKVTDLDTNEIEKIITSSDNLVQIPLNDRAIKLDNKMKGIIIYDKTSRYSNNNILAHVIGYINKSDNEGKSGIELMYDDILQMEDKFGCISITTDGKKRAIPGIPYNVISENDFENTNSVKLTIDYNIQKIAENAMDKNKKKGAVIVTEVKSGDILAMVSRPNISQNNIHKHIYSNNMDLYNKSIQVGYPPASVFKIVVLLAALEEEKIELDEKFLCKGYEIVGNNKIKCHSYNDGGHGELDIKEAFYDSCNSAFIQLGKRIGAKAIMERARKLGFGSKVGIQLMEEIDGNLPSGDELLGPSIGNISIGQGNIEVTPLQVTNMMTILANNGIKKDLTIVDAIVTDKKHEVKSVRREKPKRLISSYNSYILRKFMEEVVNKGTASRYILLDNIGGAAGKTGTAEAIANNKEIKHSWFAGYFPKNKPKYVITVLVENSVSGGKSAGPVFEEIAKQIYNIEKY